jgi:hypothetical protein
MTSIDHMKNLRDKAIVIKRMFTVLLNFTDNRHDPVLKERDCRSEMNTASCQMSLLDIKDNGDSKINSKTEKLSDIWVGT